MPDMEQTIMGDTLFMTENLYGEKFDFAKADLVGSKLNGRYRIIEKLGEGGLGMVFLVQDLHRSDEVFYCVKIIKNPEFAGLLEQEVKKLEVFDNENIVEVISFNKAEAGEPPFILMEYIEGITLEKHLMENSKLSPEDADKIFLNIAKAMEYAHSKDIIHRDLKNENIMLSKDDKVKILDFGVAQFVSEDEEQEFAGTLKYMSPEQLENKALNFTTDIYSFGIMLYEALAGEVPFAFGEIKYRILNEEPEKFEAVSDKHWKIISKCLQKNPKDRFKSFSELILEFKLESFVEDTIIPQLTEEVLSEPVEKELFSIGKQEGFTENQIKECIARAMALTNTKKLYTTHISEIIEKIEVYVESVKGRVIEEQYNDFYASLENSYVDMDPEDVEEYCRTNIDKFKSNLESLTKTRFKKAETLFKKAEFNQAVELYQELINEGSAKAEVRMAYMYRKGIFFDKDIEEAKLLLKSAAAFNHLPAFNELGNVYKAVEDYETAISWYEKASALDFAPADNSLGTIYRDGLGVEQSYRKALKYYRKAEKAGYSDAQNSLGYMYKNGLGLKANPKEAVKWYKKAAASGNSSAQVNLAYMFRNGLGVIKDEKKSVEWYEKAAKNGNVNAMNNLGVAYQKGEGTSRNYKNALEWYEKAAERAYAPAQNNLGNIYELGLGIVQDFYKAFELYQKSSDADYTPAHTNLGQMYEKGRGVEKDYNIAHELYQKAAEQGSNRALYNIGMLYYNGYGFSKDIKTALDWFKKAFNEGNLDACYKLGEMNFEGDGIDQNYQLAFNWFEQAAEAGHKEAQIKLSDLYKNGYGVNRNLDEAQRWLDLAGVSDEAEITELNEAPPEESEDEVVE